MQKTGSKVSIPNNSRRITCLQLVWKLMTSIISNKIYGYLDQQLLLPGELERCKNKWSRGTNNVLFYTDRAVIRELSPGNGAYNDMDRL